MRTLVAKGRNDRLMVVAPAGNANPCSLPRGRIAAIGGNQQRRAQLPPIGEHDHDAIGGALYRRHPRFPQDPQINAGFGAST